MFSLTQLEMETLVVNYKEGDFTSRVQFNPIRNGETLVVNYKEGDVISRV